MVIFKTDIYNPKIMISICTNLEKELKKTLVNASEIWIAVAMIHNRGWSLFKNLDFNIKKQFIVGIDLPTPPSILESLLKSTSDYCSSKVYECKYTYHPKLYVVKSKTRDYNAFVGSSNATEWGLNHNIELNIKITNHNDCKKLIQWFQEIDKKASFITQELIKEYRTRYKSIKDSQNNTKKEIDMLKQFIALDSKSFFEEKHHAVFAKEFHKTQNNSIKEDRRVVRKKLLELHFLLITKFEKFGLNDLHPTLRLQEQTCRFYFNRFSGNSIPSLWLHYGKSPSHLSIYNRNENSFTNHARIQIIIHDNSIGVWLVLGRVGGSYIDRQFFRDNLKKGNNLDHFYQELKKLPKQYWLNNHVSKVELIKNIKTIDCLKVLLKEEEKHQDKYFIIGVNINKKKPDLYQNKIADFLLEQVSILYPLYLLMRHK